MEAQYVATKLAKGFIRTVNIESNSRLCMASAASGYKQSLGADGPPGSYSDIDCTDLFFVIGSNMADCHPILFLRMADRLRSGAKLIVVDPRRTATADKADLFLQIRPGTDLALLNGLLHLLVSDGAIDTEFIAEHTQGWEAMPEFLTEYPPQRVADITGLAEADIRSAATMIAEAGEWMTLWTMGLNQSTHGTWNTNAICNLHLATGAICRSGSGPMSLTGQPNAMGGREMGYMGPGLPGQRSVDSANDRAFAESKWGLAPGSIRTEVGTGTIGMFEKMAAGDIKACWVICTNPVASVANRANVINGLQAAELVIAQDAYADTATNRYADVVLPAALWTEAEGVMVNSERNLTLVRQCLPPVGRSRPDWQLICQIATAMGFDGFGYQSSEEIFEEIRTFWNPLTGYDIRGASYPRLRRGPLQWPCPPDDREDRHPIRYLNDGISQSHHINADGEATRLAFPTPSRRAVFHARPHTEPHEMPDGDYPLVLNTGRLPHQWHTLTKTGRIDKLNKLDGSPFVELHPDDADVLGIVDGQAVELQSRRGRAVLNAVITDRVLAGSCFAPFHWNDEHGEYLAVNALTSDAVDTDSLQPELKICAVSVRPTKTVGAKDAVTEPYPMRAHPVATALGVAGRRPPPITDDEKRYLAGFFTALGGDVVGVPVLPAIAPVSRALRLWVDGALAGAFSRAADTPDDAGLDGVAGPWVLWASQTGNTEELAARITNQLAGEGVTARLVNMDECALEDLVDAGDVIVVTSTFGDGGPPDNGADFWDRLHAATAPPLDGMRFAVLGIGDRSYGQFCGHARSLDTRLTELGAARLLTLTECEIHDEEPLAAWTQQVLATITARAPAPAPPAMPKSSRSVAPFTRTTPILAQLSRNVRLTPTAAGKEVRQFGFDISEHDVSYSVGDALGVQPANSDHDVAAWLAATGLNGNQTIKVDGAECSLREALTRSYDIRRVTQNLLDFLAEEAADRSLVRQLRASRSATDGRRRGRSGIDVVRGARVRASAEQWQEVLVRLTPRLYSISSSPLVNPHEVQLTVSIVRAQDSDGGWPAGVCSTFLADRAGDHPVPVFLQKSPNFRPPKDPTAPIIMIGAGTGIAPFRGFLQERRALGHTGRNWLFFGDRHRAQNFYYRDELTSMVDDGFLTWLDLAFSRDQSRRIYVQDRMIDSAVRLWNWLQDGAHIYVCGDAANMAVGVDAAISTIVQTHGRMDAEQARDYKRELVASKRYLREVY
jgi:NADPH-dependent sulfite reductase flavoprotein alpha-component